MKTGAHWQRMLRMLPTMVRQDLIVKPVAEFGQPPLEAREFAGELVVFILAHYKKFERITGDNRGDGQPRRPIGGPTSSDSEPDLEGPDPASLEAYVQTISHRGLKDLLVGLVDLMKVCNG